ncbi:MAG: hypothetical protein ABIJ82_03980 [Patescibacteria group bacterium]|nr:hypothetical protein [Patescibacteria group bacterium]MBU1952665.1 hypothetical protein [Patescibacteria group bacterium]
MENNSYSVQTSAGRSFRTFLLTLSVSLILFSTVYYFLTTNASRPEALETSLNEKTVKKVSDDSEVKNQGEVAGLATKTVFGEIASKETGGQVRQVLAGSTETSQTTTTAPSTGTTGVTIGLFSALIFFVASLFVVSKNPRKLALSSFERKISNSMNEDGSH